MNSTMVVKQGTPSKPGEMVDTDAAKVVPPSSEVKTERAAREVAAQQKATREKIGNLAKKMTHPARAKDEAVKAAGKGSTKAKPAAAKAAKGKATTGNTGNAFPRITAEWTSAKGKDVKVKDRVRTADGIVIDVIGRWTKKAKDGNVPMVTGHIVAFGAGKKDATEGGKGKGVGDRCNAVAAEVTHAAK
jgi:hypothetical protein